MFDGAAAEAAAAAAKAAVREENLADTEAAVSLRVNVNTTQQYSEEQASACDLWCLRHTRTCHLVQQQLRMGRAEQG